MKNNIVKGIIGNGLAQIILKVIRVMEQLLLIPFFLTAWGAAYYGEWVTLSIIPTVLAFSNLGFGTAAGNSFVLAYISGDRQKAADINKSGILVIFGSIIVGFIITTFVLFCGKHLNIFDKSLIPEDEAIIAIALLMTGRFIKFYHLLVDGYFRGTRKAALGSFIYSVYPASNLLAGFSALLAGCGVVGYAFSQFIVAILFTIFYFVVGIKTIDLKSCQGRYKLTDIKQITSKGIGYMMDPVWQCIYFQGSTLVVRLVLGPETVAMFNTMRTACRSVSQIFNVINGSVFPELQFEYGKGNMQTVHRLFRISILTSILVGIIGSVLLALFGMDIYTLWTQSMLSVSIEIWNTFVVGILFNAVWWTSMIAYPVTNKPYNFAVASTIIACLSVGVSYFLSFYLGLLGAVLGTILFDVIMMFFVLPDSCKLLGMRTIDIFTNMNELLLYFKSKLSVSRK